MVFQSTHPHGVRLIKMCTVPSLRMVSIHAPTRGATLESLPWPRSPQNRFNPRTHTGCDVLYYLKSVCFQTFQSTHPHGVRLLFQIMYAHQSDGFNPRTHTGCDVALFGTTAKQWRVSIHAPTRGATYLPEREPPSSMFQSTHPHGVRLLSEVGYDTPIFRFQSTHPHGVRRFRYFPPACPTASFNPRTHTGCDSLLRLLA